MMFCGEKVKTNYIVAVATRADCRHQGMMRLLLQASLQEMYREKETFTWLMPGCRSHLSSVWLSDLFMKK